MITAIRNLHEHETLIDFAGTRAGQALIIIVASVLLIWGDVSPLMIPAIVIVSLIPTQRRNVLLILAVAWLVLLLLRRQGIQLTMDEIRLDTITSLRWNRFIAQLVITSALIWFIYQFARHLRSMPAPVRKHPVLLVHAVIWILLALTPISGFGALGIAGFLSWRFCYLILDVSRQSPGQARLGDHLYYLLPIFGGTSTPYGKGGQYLDRKRSRDTRALAMSQLAGIKLLVLAVLWQITVTLLDRHVFCVPAGKTINSFVYQSFGIVRLPELLSSGANASLPMLWSSLYLELIRVTLELAIAGHIIVGNLRLLGFNIFRNTYKPLLATSIVEFWNRFYYYFKELLTQFFFYPVYLRTAWAGPNLRLMLAVFAAAFLGNMYFHLLVDYRHMLTFEFSSIWAQWGPRLVYCFALAGGISISMLRQKSKRAGGEDVAVWHRVRQIAGVWTFYSFIHIWALRVPEAGYADRIQFILRFVGIS